MAMDMQTSININATVPKEWYQEWLAYFASVDALFAVAAILLALWVGRVISTFFNKDIRILLLSDLAFGLTFGLFFGWWFLGSAKAGFAIAGMLFLISAAAVRYLLRKASPPWQKAVGDFMRGKLKVPANG